MHVIWKAKELGLSMAGSVDFDVLDAVPEFQRGGLEVGLPFSSGIETRVHLPEFPDKEFSSPHEPGWLIIWVMVLPAFLIKVVK